jgi:hypothetical protein
MEITVFSRLISAFLASCHTIKPKIYVADSPRERRVAARERGRNGGVEHKEETEPQDKGPRDARAALRVSVRAVARVPPPTEL